MIDIKMSQENLVQTLKSLSTECVDQKQVFKRLHELLDSKLETIVEDLSLSGSEEPQSKILRQALQHVDYVSLMEKYLSSKGDYIYSKVMYDTHLMLFEARRSISSYRRQVIVSGKK